MTTSVVPPSSGSPQAPDPVIDLLFVQGCPSLGAARARLSAALAAARLPPWWREWNLDREDTPAALRSHGSPTILVDGRDVAGPPDPGHGRTCRLGGAPAVDEILSALNRRRSGE